MIALLTLVFVLSGAAGLMYESIWSRYLSLFVGHSAYAQIIVLVIFLGGMSVGALIVGARSERLRHPLLWYAGVEALVAVIGFAFHRVFTAVSLVAYDSLFPSLAGNAGWTLVTVKWLLACLLILPQSILLGATFPLMSAGVIRLAREHAGRLLGLLYFANSLGAAIGVLVAGFVLIDRFGLPGTLATAAGLNVVAAVVVGLAGWWHARAPVTAIADAHAPDVAADSDASPPFAQAPGFTRAVLLVSFGTAIASFIYEIAWIRMLSLVLGSATHSFELMLSAFILGLALGAFWIRGRADELRDPVGVLGMTQWIMGTLAVATLPLYVASFGWMATLLATFRQSGAGYNGFLIARYAISLLVMLPATFCAGITLPLITNILMRSAGRGHGERAIGAVYGVNTLGSIVGVVLAGLVLMPLLGLKLLLITGALVDIALGFMLLMLDAGRRPVTRPALLGPRPARPASRIALLAVATVCFVVMTGAFIPFDPARLTSGVYRYAVLPRAGVYTVPFYKDGRTATVSVRRMAGGFITLSTNGKPDASMDAIWRDTSDRARPPLVLERDIATQLLLPIITLAHNPGAREGAVIGQGSGMTSHILLGSPAMQRLVTIEIEPEMINASRAFRPANRRVFEDPRSTFVIDDAKSYFAASGRRFDLILSEPSNPWVSGVSGLFTREFYARVRRQLAPNGIFGQWLHLYEIDDRLAATVLAALDESFDAYEIFFTSNADILIVAAAGRTLGAPDWNVVALPGIMHDLRRVVPLGSEELEGTRLAGRELLHPYLSLHATPNSDFFPVLDLGAERTRYLRENAEGISGLAGGRFDVPAVIAGRRLVFGEALLAAMPEITRVAKLALGARVRAARALSPASRDSARVLARDDDFARALSDLDALDRLLASGSPPADWRIWVDQVREAERVLHGGTAGVADEAFYGRVRDYVRRARAPEPAAASVEFLHGLAAWDFAAASRAGEVLLQRSMRDSVYWLPATFVRNGTVVSRIKLGDFAGARAAFKAYVRFVDQDAFTARVLGAYLLEMERRAE